jgi:Holliday junction resolvase RusA-like endonuclease
VTKPDAIQFWVSGVPATKGSTRGFPFKRRDGSLGVAISNDNKKAKAWATEVSDAAVRAMSGMAPFPGSVRVSVDFYLRRPKVQFRANKRLKDWAPVHCATKPDGDKLLRCLWDALKGVVIGDDAQVVEWSGRKLYSNDGRTGALVTVEPLAEVARAEAPEQRRLFAVGAEDEAPEIR